MRASGTSRSHHGRRSWRGAPAQRGPERGRLATAATAPHGFHPTFATVAVQQSAGAAGAFECARCAGRLSVLSRAARQRARTLASREDSAIVIGVSCSNFNSTRWPVGGLPPSCRATPHPRHPASGSQLRGCAKPYQNWHGSRAAREPRRSLQRLQRQRAYAHATKQLTRGVSSINRTH